jgi:hypothetical protein
MAAVGIAESQIAKCIGEHGLSPMTLRKHFRRELDTSLLKANARVAQALYIEAVEKHNVTAMIFFLRCKGGWFQTDAHRFVDETGKDRPFMLSDVDRIISEAEAEEAK